MLVAFANRYRHGSAGGYIDPLTRWRWAVITLHVQSCNGNPPNSTVAGNPNATREIFWDAVDSAARLRKTQANPAISNHGRDGRDNSNPMEADADHGTRIVGSILLRFSLSAILHLAILARQSKSHCRAGPNSLLQASRICCLSPAALSALPHQ